VDAGAALLFASVEPAVFPPRVKGDLAGACPEAAPPNRLGVVEDEVVAGFAAPNKDDVWEPPPLWLF
jgi:hypothetical protein